MPIFFKIDGADSIGGTDSLVPYCDRSIEPVEHDRDAFDCSGLVQWAAAIDPTPTGDLAWTFHGTSEDAGLPDGGGDVGMIRPGNYQAARVGSSASVPGESFADGIVPPIQPVYDFIA
jgi:hypothetical protein